MDESMEQMFQRVMSQWIEQNVLGGQDMWAHIEHLYVTEGEAEAEEALNTYMAKYIEEDLGIKR